MAFFPPGHAGGSPLRPLQPKSCTWCSGPVAASDRHLRCIGCLGFQHAFDALLPPGPSTCPFCADFGVDRRQRRLETAQRCCARNANDDEVDPDPGPRGHFAPPASGPVRSAPWRVDEQGSLRAPPRGAATQQGYAAGYRPETCGVRSAPSHNPFINPEPPREDEANHLPSYQVPAPDIHMTSPRPDAVTAGSGQAFSPHWSASPSGATRRPAAAARLQFQAPLDLPFLLDGSEAASVAPNFGRNQPSGSSKGRRNAPGSRAGLGAERGPHAR